jgi:hypothetical protein
VAAPKQRNTEAERATIKAGGIPEGWTEKPAKLRQKDRDGRWTARLIQSAEVRTGPVRDPRPLRRRLVHAVRGRFQWHPNPHAAATKTMTSRSWVSTAKATRTASPFQQGSSKLAEAPH